MADTDKLKRELEFFRLKKPEFLKTYKDQFVLIKSDVLVGTYTTEAEAYKAGVDKFGNEPFLIKQVVEKEESISFPALAVGLISVSL
jgi:hypothetical protein